MMPKRVAVRLDRKHSWALLSGQSVTIKVPKDADELTIQMSDVAGQPQRESSFAELLDVFFNGRRARA